jgi:hypothetical protein
VPQSFWGVHQYASNAVEVGLEFDEDGREFWGIPNWNDRGSPLQVEEEIRLMKEPVTQRVMVRMAVTLQMTLAGQNVSIQGFTESVSGRGAMLLCARSIAAGTKIDIQLDRTGQRRECRVARPAVERQQSYLVPIEFLSPAPDFWHISFPTPDWQALDD